MIMRIEREFDLYHRILFMPIFGPLLCLLRVPKSKNKLAKLWPRFAKSVTRPTSSVILFQHLLATSKTPRPPPTKLTPVSCVYLQRYLQYNQSRGKSQNPLRTREKTKRNKNKSP